MKIFYSWQSDLPNNTNRGFIRKALEAALKDATADMNIADAERPEIDEATKNTKGMVDIRESILRKIGECQIYVADLTPVSHTKRRKALPNPNVMYETGFASNRPGYDFIIGVMNTHNNKGPDSLPFDLRGRRILTYNLSTEADQKTRATALKALTRSLAGAIRENLPSVAQKMSDENPIQPAPHDESDFSLWGIGSNAKIRVHSSDYRDDLTILRGPRAYARIIPATWPNGAPTALDIKGTPRKVEADYTGRNAGSYGTCEHGFIRYWFDSDPNSKSRATGSLTLYLEDFGEYWCISDGPFHNGPKGHIVYPPHALSFWRDATRQALALFDDLGASKRRLVEIGVAGIKDAFLASEFHAQSPQSRKDSVRLSSQLATWDDDGLKSLWQEGYDRLLSAFSQPRISNDAFEKLLG